jgi:hypothetical protein
MRILRAWILAAFLVAGCGGEAATDANSSGENAATSAEVTVTAITWEDLMPEGEDQKLEELYNQFYADLEARFQQNETTLMESAKDQDIATLIQEGSADDSMEQIGTFNVVEDLNGEAIRIPGYVVPFNFSRTSEYDEFLLVPYFGACLHTPPPPPNQILYVKASPSAKVESIYDPVWLEGTLKTGEFMSELGNSAYELQLSKIEPYEY